MYDILDAYNAWHDSLCDEYDEWSGGLGSIADDDNGLLGCEWWCEDEDEIEFEMLDAEYAYALLWRGALKGVVLA